MKLPKKASKTLGELCKEFPDWCFMAIPNTDSKDVFVQKIQEALNTK